MAEEKATGLLVAPEDSRDARYAAFEEVLGDGQYPVRFWLKRLPFVRDQRSHPSCVLQTVARIIDYANRAEGDTSRNSARYGFAYAKLWDGQPTLQGTYTKIGLQVATKLGLALITNWPDDSKLSKAEYLKHPTPAADASAAPFRIKENYINARTLNEVKDYLMKFELPLTMQINSNNSGWGGSVVKKNNNTLKEPTGNRTGHLVTCVGWDDELGCLLFDNSWGDDWGDEGRGWVPYDYSGLAKSWYGVYDLPNNWQEKNNNYKENMKYEELNAVQYAIYFLIRGKYPKPEELGAVKARNDIILNAFAKGGQAGQEIIDQNLLAFRDEFKKNVKDGLV